MSNVLPPASSRFVVRQYRARLLLTVSLAAICAAFLSAAAFLPSYLAVAMSGTPTTPAPAQTGGGDGIALTHAQMLMRTLQPIAQASTTPMALIKEALALKPSGVAITHINYSAGSADTLMLAGQGDPDSIDAYRRALQGDGAFSNVSVPIEDLAGSSGGQFSITITGQF